MVQDEIVNQDQEVIQAIRKDYKAYINLEADGAEFKSYIARSINKPLIQLMMDDIDWDINEKKEKKEVVYVEEDDPFGFLRN